MKMSVPIWVHGVRAAMHSDKLGCKIAPSMHDKI
jgi:hypothetical protein